MTEYGVLALQGDWAAHGAILRDLGALTRPVRTAADLAQVDALVIPGGESSAMLRLMEPENLARRIRDRITAGMAILATCAGVILLAEHIQPPQESLGVLGVDVIRNAYGRQPHSTVGEITLAHRVGRTVSNGGRVHSRSTNRRCEFRGRRARPIPRRPGSGPSGENPGSDISSGADCGSPDPQLTDVSSSTGPALLEDPR